MGKMKQIHMDIEEFKETMKQKWNIELKVFMTEKGVTRVTGGMNRITILQALRLYKMVFNFPSILGLIGSDDSIEEENGILDYLITLFDKDGPLKDKDERERPFSLENLPKCRICGNPVPQVQYEEFLSEVYWNRYVCTHCQKVR